MAKSKQISDQTIDESYQSRQSVKINKDINNKTQSYEFTILVRDKTPFTGKLSREDMETIYQLYSSQGGNVQVKTLAREFPQYTLNQVKQILRAFNITKACTPIAPHQLEEMTVQEASIYALNVKEKTFLKKLEEDKIKFNEKKVVDLTKEVQSLKDQFKNIQEVFNNYKIPTHNVNLPIETSKDTLLVVLSDIHVGAYNSEYSIYGNTYDQAELHKRFFTILTRLSNLPKTYDKIVVVNLGDSLDGYNEETTRGGHKLPQNMNNKEQVKVFLDEMLYLMEGLHELCKNVNYYCVGEANHCGDYGWLANEKLASIFDIYFNGDVESQIFDKFINHFRINDTTFICTHGKDNRDMFSNYPLTLDLKTESKLNEYIDYHNINTPKIVVLKGDLHQSAITYGKKFMYWSIGSIFGSSEWIHKNFGNTKAVCEYGLLNNKFNDLSTNKILLN